MFDEFIGANDTSPEMQDLIDPRLRAMSPEEKLLRCCKLSGAVRLLVLAGIKDRYPECTPDELRKRFAAVTLGREFSLRYFNWDPDKEGY